MDIKVFGSWDFYHWGKGWDSVEQARAWNKYWSNFNETHADSRWRYLEIGEGVTQEHLLVCGNCLVWQRSTKKLQLADVLSTSKKWQEKNSAVRVVPSKTM